ncbi:probable phosphoribosylaminoimidazole-succinocarboxamide synthase [Cephalotrichum gorgonifer]|uniref:Phosphoribosylaminoimidazole-succinocarboxamide synthase n=1 Tax=Cephalotrichum gorgonifer TaxID=2041049 RepID=A0AAE8SSU3_9PEZI|nr:probable phosphoribosylaminoimidazole-succinocarboxamide synthase [Cephalotrichum gorgonifer]
MALTTISLPTLEKLSSGKVRDIFVVDAQTLLFVASDRISAYDAILANGIPNKGAILTLASAHWFGLLPSLLPSLRTHFVSLSIPASLPVTDDERAALRNRSMVVRKLRILPIEAIVRGYITGSGWKEYKSKGTVHGISLPAGLQQCERLPQPLYTPSTKAEAGEHDENIHPSQAAALIGSEHAAKVEALSLAIYTAAAQYALERGIIIADTKFEFALDENDEVVLADEVLTPDSSRFWDAATYAPGRDQDSFDKQIVRNWLTKEGLAGKEGVELPAEVCTATEEKYKDVFLKLTGKTFEDAAKAAQA